ncbi:hypothetical protein [Paenibacillus luteus]|uniref:hypothetical protein n=1 Tax=Paenibacillus luteus TaxID=2545753 RepID=UPI0011417A55|nr:hypothetical protein [Paenibacillus luteus]
MNNIVRLYGESQLNKMRLQLARMKKPEGVPYFLTATDEGALIRQVKFDTYLEVAFRHEIMEDDLKNRLMSNAWNTFFQAKNELMAAYCVESNGHKISFHPKGKNNTKDEFTIHTESDDIFVEVKSPIKEPDSIVWSGNDALSIRKTIKDATNKQLDKNNTNLLIFSGDMRIPITHSYHSGIIEALYGEEKLVLSINSSNLSNAPERSFEVSGLFQSHRNTRISAVATLQDLLTEKGFHYSFKLFHNPFALKKISIDLFKGIKQYVYNDETDQMNWI